MKFLIFGTVLACVAVAFPLVKEDAADAACGPAFQLDTVLPKHSVALAAGMCVVDLGSLHAADREAAVKGAGGMETYCYYTVQLVRQYR